ncbi:hypothetical protein [Herbiconiux daphne]|uniref:Uncharacterized protein n=1 Tax=Herbiconiux daphne TaxID=2970914 RepID=A0ABT2H826_9MICO|nr:hypothetical protein [Herbiconiux daphne]MCS5736047.1 hypothetical protein [Herbiconiux daphne]
MAAQIDRRVLLKGSFIVAAAGVLAACTADEAPSSPTPSASRPPATPTPTPEPTRSGGARPAAAVSFGPNGTHYPAELPWLGEQAATELVAECDWADIAAKIATLDAATTAAGAIIRVKPGVLPGEGSKSSSPAALTEVGGADWTVPVVICPLEGFGSVTVAAEGIRLDKCAGLAFYGLLSTGAFTLTQCSNLQIGWSRFDGMGITQGGTAIAMYELVLGFRQNETDTAAVRPTEAYAMTDISRHGCVFGPSVKPEGSEAHCDTIQLEGTGSGPFGPFTSVDCVDYGSSNSAELLKDNLIYADYQHCLILGGLLPWLVQPLKPGDYSGEPNAFAGGCRDVRLTDSVVSGAVGRMGFTTVENTTLSYEPVAKQQPSQSGSWTFDPAIKGWTRDDILGLQSVPDYEVATLTKLWAW